MKETVCLDEELKKTLEERKKQIEIIECYQEIIKSCSFLVQNKKDKFKKSGAYPIIEKEILDFCHLRLRSLANSDGKEDISPSLNSEEIAVLKKFALKILKSNGSYLEVSTNEDTVTPHVPPPPPVPIPVPPIVEETQPKKRLRFADKVLAKKKQNVIMPEETEGRDPREFVGQTTRTMSHQTLIPLGPVINSLATYSLVKILDVKGNKATIEFTNGGVKAEIDLAELAGFEYRD